MGSTSTAAQSLALTPRVQSRMMPLSNAEVSAFLDWLRHPRPDMTLFVMDTALHLADKVVPMLVRQLTRRLGSASVTPYRIVREVWALTPHLYASAATPPWPRSPR